ncbi:hypothetical protein ACQ4LE_006392 [Meloidogyne hapla]|uniref:Secreted protein n=1 Tax=Meloidogyne hapla TaxID=6305 RepID=A0A1I8BXM8_MELHA
MIFYSLLVFLLVVGFNEGKSCNKTQGSLTFLTNTLRFTPNDGIPNRFNGDVTNNICKNNTLQTNCYNHVASKQSIGKVVCNKNICICNYNETNKQTCYKANKTKDYVLDYMFYSYNGFIFINPNTGGQKLERTTGNKTFEHKVKAEMNLTAGTKSYLHGKALLVGCTTCDKLNANGTLRTC